MTRLPLPPLPPVARDARPGGRSMLDLLTAEHRGLVELCARLAEPVAASVFTAGLVRHLSAEEQYLYPTLRAVLPDGDRLADAEVAADARLHRALHPLSAPEVTAALRGHVERCHTRLFPALRAVLDDAALIRLGNRVLIAEEAAPTRPHPATPFTPPWNRVVEPAVGVLDKVRDALSGRPTRATDLASR
jgi:hemerythrin HHE cation binding domain-containing protein